VEGYIKDNIGPKALLRDLQKTALVLARFGPKLPRLVEAYLVRQSLPPPLLLPVNKLLPLLWALLGAGVALGGVLLGQSL
jgi:ubiquinone biosynthesis protein